MPVISTVYDRIIRAVATQLRQSGIWPEGTNMTAVAKEFLPKDFWDNFSSAPWNETMTIELTDQLSLELVRDRGKVSAFLKLKVPAIPAVTIAEW